MVIAATLATLAAQAPVAPVAAGAAPVAATRSPLGPTTARAAVLEVRDDGTVVALDRPTEALLGDAMAGPALVERVDLVWGCRGDRRRASLLEGEERPGAWLPDACVVRADVRPPCPPAVDDAGLDDDDARALAVAAAEQHRGAAVAHQQRMARLRAGFPQWGPGLRVVVTGGGPLTLTTSQLGLETCECDGSTARALGDQHVTVVLPKLDRPTVLWWPVPRYLGALHRLGAAPASAGGALSFVEPFQAADDDPERDGTSVSVFSAPAGCDCASCDGLE